MAGPAHDDLELLVRHLEVLGPPAGWEAAAEYDSLALAVLDSVWSIGVRYGGVLNVLERYRALRLAAGHDADADTPAQLAGCIAEAGGPAAFAEIVGNRQRTSSRNGILKAEAVQRQAAMLAEEDVVAPADLSALPAEELSRVRARWLEVPGQGSGLSWNYFLMLARMPGVKADRMVRRFVATALGRPGESAVPPDEAVALVTAAADRIGVEDRLLDYAIWRHQSNGEGQAADAPVPARPVEPGMAGLSRRPSGIWSDEAGTVGAASGPTGIFVGWLDVAWDGPATPVDRLRDVVHLPPGGVAGDVAAALARAAACREEALQECGRCGSRSIPGHMHSSDVCQACAERHLGVAY